MNVIVGFVCCGRARFDDFVARKETALVVCSFFPQITSSEYSFGQGVFLVPCRERDERVLSHTLMCGYIADRGGQKQSHRRVAFPWRGPVYIKSARAWLDISVRCGLDTQDGTVRNLEQTKPTHRSWTACAGMLIAHPAVL